MAEGPPSCGLRARSLAFLFDLDDTLFDCTGQLTGPARRRAAEVLARGTGLPAEDLVELQERRSDEDGTEALAAVAREMEASPSLLEAALAAYNRETVEPIAPMPGALTALNRLRTAGAALACVTAGRPARQREKVRLLGLSGYFSEARGTLYLHDPRAEGRDKGPTLSRAAAALGRPPLSTVVVGDRLDGEIASGNRLGMITVRLRHGRQRDRHPCGPDELPRFEIDRIGDLSSLFIL